MPRFVDHDVRRAELLDGAFALFVREGYGGVTMRGLAAALGVSTGTLYHYFGGKEAIFEQMVSRVADEDVAAIEALHAPDAPPGERVDRAFAFAKLREERLRSFMNLSFDAQRHHPGAEMRVLATGAFERYRVALRRHLGDIAPSVSDTLLTLIVGRLMSGGLDAEPPGWDVLLDAARRLVD